LERKRVILYVGFSTPRKGVEYIAQALDGLGPDCRLLLVGKWEPGYRAKFYRSLPPGVRGKVVEAGYVSDEELPLYYSMADVFVFPSLLEGFGLPPLEAMACGTPVVAASASSLPEVVGDAGLLVPAMDAQALAGALQRLLTDEELRSTLAIRGLERARSVYNKRNMVTGTLKVYQTYLTEK
jgi:glycosyltransferase involved in cell wall biosynthesis